MINNKLGRVMISTLRYLTAKSVKWKQKGNAYGNQKETVLEHDQVLSTGGITRREQKQETLRCEGSKVANNTHEVITKRASNSNMSETANGCTSAMVTKATVLVDVVELLCGCL